MAAWERLEELALSKPKLEQLFTDKTRAERYTVSACDMVMDF